jgi:hypothetical protein
LSVDEFVRDPEVHRLPLRGNDGTILLERFELLDDTMKTGRIALRTSDATKSRQVRTVRSRKQRLDRPARVGIDLGAAFPHCDTNKLRERTSALVEDISGRWGWLLGFASRLVQTATGDNQSGGDRPEMMKAGGDSRAHALTVDVRVFVVDASTTIEM